MNSPDLLIVGGGVIGAASAFFAARAGLGTTLLEKRAGLGTLTTAASLAAFRAQFGEAENIAMMLESIAFYEHIRERTGLSDADIQLTQAGYLFATTADDGYERCRLRVDLQRGLGLSDVELWDGDEARRHFPFLSTRVTAATFRARDGWLSPHELTHCYAHASGAEIRLEHQVIEIVVTKNRVRGVRTAHELIESDRVVVAAGPFTSGLLEPLTVHLPIELIRRQRTAVKAHALIPRNAPMTIDSDTGAHWHPDGHGAVLAWALPEEPAPALDEVSPDWDFPALVLDGVSRIAPFWRDIADSLHRSDLDTRAGQYDMTPDARPLIGAVSGIEGLYVNCGYSGHGVMASAGGARILADLITGKLEDAANPFRVSRFDGQSLPGLREKMVL